MSPGPLFIRATTESPHVVLEVEGYLDGSTHRLLDAALQPWFEEDRRVSVDLAGVTFIDSDGLEALLEADRTLKQDGRRLLLRNVPQAVAHTLTLSGLDGDFEREDEAAAPAG